MTALAPSAPDDMAARLAQFAARLRPHSSAVSPRRPERAIQAVHLPQHPATQHHRNHRLP
ncbi:hypothetical protein [Streptomyces bottropensis]|uniref:hypothetical protein n=1 Tax=Streptomyces bottropensis TaxID=42235 RepID=UPI003680C2C0